MDIVLLFGGIIIIASVGMVVFSNQGEKSDKISSETTSGTLSKKYNNLESFKGLAYLMMILSTGLFVYGIIQFIDAPSIAKNGYVAMISSFTYAFSMVTLFCLTKIIDFLFDLDMPKSDK